MPPTPTPTPMRGLKKAAFSLIPVLVLLVGAELVARLVGPPPSHLADHLGGAPPHFMELDPELGWRYRPGERVEDPDFEAWSRAHGLPWPPASQIVVNSRGMRDEPVDATRPDGQLRVYSMGDSSVFGSGVAWDQTFSQLLERQLVTERGADPAARPRPVEVYNAGVAGHSSFQALALLEQNLDLRPDVVIAYLMNSDLMEFRGSPDSIWFKRWYRGVDLPLQQRSTALRWVRWWRSYYLPFQRASDGLMLRVRVEDFRSNLQGLLALGRRHGFATVFVLPPVQSDLTHPRDAVAHLPGGAHPPGRTEADWDALAAQVQAAQASADWTGQTRTHFRQALLLEARTAGVPVVDGAVLFLDAWQAAPERYQGADALFVDRIHPSASGHALLAEALLPVVRAQLPSAGARP